VACCPAGHELPGRDRRRPCASCRREQLIRHVITAEGSLPAATVAAAVGAVVTSAAVLRELAAAAAADPAMLRHGAPPAAGRLVSELIARGSTTLAPPRCARCGRAGVPLFRTPGGGMCKACTARQNTAECAHCGKVKAAAGRDGAGQRICERCRRRDRGHRQCGRCGKTASIAVRARDGAPDTCVNCYRMPSAVCSVCGTYRECNFAASDHPVCPSCTPRAPARCARCGQDRPAQARWPEGPVCDPCYTAALQYRAPCAACGQLRRLVSPPGPGATTCATCAGLPVTCACTSCGTEDKLYQKGLCARCSLRHRATALLTGPGADIPAALAPVLEAICAARNPRSALNWLSRSETAALLAQVTSGTLPATHEALDACPRRRAADQLRQILISGGALPARDEELTRAEQWLAALLSDITDPGHRQLVRAFATWHVMRRLRRAAMASPRPRTRTAHARNTIKAAARLLAWLAGRGTALAGCRQADIDDWLATSPGACNVSDFLTWAARSGHCPRLDVPRTQCRDGTAITGDRRWELAARLLNDNTLDPVDRVAGCLVLLYGQPASRIAALTTSQIASHGDDQDVTIQLGQHDIPLPAPLGRLLLTLAAEGKPYAGTGTPRDRKWLFPGQLPGRPITPERLAERLRAIGVPVMAGRRTALIDLASQMPAAVLADSLGFRPATAVRWRHQAGADWNQYAAELARERNHEPGE
jgi:hypothetical protein